MNITIIRKHRDVVLICSLTFKLEGELIGIVEREHLFVRRLIIGIEDELIGEHEHGKASSHQLWRSMLLLHWLPLSSTLCPGPANSSLATLKLCELPSGEQHFPLSAP